MASTPRLLMYLRGGGLNERVNGVSAEIPSKHVAVRHCRGRRVWHAS